jgi:Predicted ATP-dependent protease
MNRVNEPSEKENFSDTPDTDLIEPVPETLTTDNKSEETDAPIAEAKGANGTSDNEPDQQVDDGSSRSVTVPEKLIDQVIGQEHAVEVIRKAATQRRHVMMIGTPGTGKSMLAKAMAELLPKGRDAGHSGVPKL